MNANSTAIVRIVLSTIFAATFGIGCASEPEGQDTDVNMEVSSTQLTTTEWTGKCPNINGGSTHKDVKNNTWVECRNGRVYATYANK